MPNKKILLAVAIMVCILFPVFSQSDNRLAIYPFTGTVELADTGKAVADKLEADPTLRNAFEVLPRNEALEAYAAEHRKSESSDYTNKDKLTEFGEIYGANFILLGQFCILGGDRKLFLPSIINAVSTQQISGDYRQYNTTDDIVQFLPETTEYLVSAYKKKSF